MNVLQMFAEYLQNEASYWLQISCLQITKVSNRIQLVYYVELNRIQLYHIDIKIQR